MGAVAGTTSSTARWSRRGADLDRQGAGRPLAAGARRRSCSASPSVSLRLPPALAGMLVGAAALRPRAARLRPLGGAGRRRRSRCCPTSVLTSRSDTMDAVMSLLLVLAALAHRARPVRRRASRPSSARRGRRARVRGQAVRGAVAVPALVLLAWLALDGRDPATSGGRSRSPASRTSPRAAAWPVVASLLPGQHPFRWDRRTGRSGTRSSSTTASQRFGNRRRARPPPGCCACSPPAPPREFGALIGVELAVALAFGALAALPRSWLRRGGDVDDERRRRIALGWGLGAWLVIGAARGQLHGPPVAALPRGVHPGRRRPCSGIGLVTHRPAAAAARSRAASARRCATRRDRGRTRRPTAVADARLAGERRSASRRARRRCCGSRARRWRSELLQRRSRCSARAWRSQPPPWRRSRRGAGRPRRRDRAPRPLGRGRLRRRRQHARREAGPAARVPAPPPPGARYEVAAASIVKAGRLIVRDARRSSSSPGPAGRQLVTPAAAAARRARGQRPLRAARRDEVHRGTAAGGARVRAGGRDVACRRPPVATSSGSAGRASRTAASSIRLCGSRCGAGGHRAAVRRLGARARSGAAADGRRARSRRAHARRGRRRRQVVLGAAFVLAAAERPSLLTSPHHGALPPGSRGRCAGCCRR